MASLSDILTTAKNIATGINQLGQTYLSVSGSKVYSNITVPTLVLSGQGRAVRVSIVVAGSADGAIYDSNSATSMVDILAILPTSTGIIDINLPVNNGIVVSPGAGQTIAISYS